MNAYIDLFSYIEHYRKGIKGNAIEEKKSRIIFNSLPKEYQRTLLQLRASIPNGSKEGYADALVELRARLCNREAYKVRTGCRNSSIVNQRFKQQYYEGKLIEIR